MRFALLFTAVVAFVSFGGGARAATVYDIDLAGFESFGDFTDPNNSLVTVNLFPFARIASVEWIDLEFTTENGSWRSEFVLSLNDSANSGAAGTFWDYRPSNDDSSGTYSGSGFFDDVNSEFSSGPFSLLADGQLVFYVYETFNDGGAARDAFISSGTLRITAVPEPSSVAVIAALFGVGGARRVWRHRRPKLPC